jgi:GNAT superfamily N-acetyltransferase
MNVTYFNYRIHIAETGWDRRGFVAQWWRVYAGDSRWVPPYFPALRHELEPANNSHLARMAPVFIHLDALPRSQARPGRGSQPLQGLSTGALFEEPVATAIVLCDPRRQDGTAHLALLHCANDTESLERLVERLAEILWVNRCRRVIGPTGLSPHLETGLLQDHWDQLPPLHTPYNPPYLPEVVSGSLRPLGRSQLYHLDIPPELPPAPPARAQMVPLEPARLATNLLPLLAAACPTWADFPPPDAEEAAFLLRWLSPWPLFGWLAQVDAQPVGFILVQPDLAPTLRKSNGGRNLLWRPWLAWAGRRPVRQGRVLFGAVLPEWQGQGIGRQLLHHALVTGYNQGWQSVSIGPVPGRAPACAFLEHHGARSQQTYWLYQQDL